MLAHDPWLFGLVPAVGLCSCVVPSAGAAASTASPEAIRAATAPALIELGEREPLTITEALVRSGRESLAAGHYAAAYRSLSLAVEREPESAPELYGDMIDAALGVGAIEVAENLIGSAQRSGEVGDARLQSQVVLAREIENSRGIGDCDARIDTESQPLQRRNDALAAWKVLRSGLPADHAIPIPVDVDAAREALCASGCSPDEPTLVRLDGDNETTIALVVPHGDSGFSVMPDVLHPVMSECTDETVFAVERYDGVVRVRAFADLREKVDVDDWRLVELPEYGPPQVSAANGSSYGYAAPSSGYQYGSSGYAYGSSGYQYHGCGGYAYDYEDYDYESCEVHSHVERDVILDLDRGEVVLDIVRTGQRGTELGRVSMTRAPSGPVVDVQACGVRETLRLSYS